MLDNFSLLLLSFALSTLLLGSTMLWRLASDPLPIPKEK